MASSNSGIPFPKWQIAIALGATGAIGLGYWYLRQQQSLKDKKKNLSAISKNTVSLDDASEDGNADLSPLQQALRLKREGNDFFKMGKYDEAINFYNKGIDICPEENKKDLATLYQNRAAAYEQFKKWSTVISDCSTALGLNVKYEKALYRRAKAYEATKDWENCLDDITAVCLLQGFQNQNALLMADRVLKQLGKQHAAEAMESRKPILASKQFIKTFFMSFTADPVHKKLIDSSVPLGTGELTGFKKAKLSFALEDYDAIIPACTDEINSSESDSEYFLEALLLRASFYLLSGQQKQALNDLNTIIDTEGVDSSIKVNALIKRASLYMQLEQTENCVEDMEKAASLGPNIADVFHHRAQIHLLLDDILKAREDFHKAVSLNPQFPIAIVQKCYADYRFALLSQQEDMLKSAMDEFKKCTEKYSDCSEAFVLYAQVLTERQEFEQAQGLYEKAKEIDPTNATILVHKGLLLLQWKGDMNNAVELMRKAIKLDEKCQFAYETLGTVEVQRTNLVVAIDLFNKAIGLARSEMEMTHLFSLRDAATSQLKIITKLGIGSQILK